MAPVAGATLESAGVVEPVAEPAGFGVLDRPVSDVVFKNSSAVERCGAREVSFGRGADPLTAPGGVGCVGLVQVVVREL